MITRLTNFALRGYQGYSIDKSLIKKVFSVRKPKTPRHESTANKDERISIKSSMTAHQNPNDEKQVRLKESIKERDIFSYPYHVNCWRKFISTIRWFFCNFCKCWCQTCQRRTHKLKKDEKIFSRGIRKLYTEIDMLELVKQLRISRFLTSLLLSRSQQELVKFLKIYALDRPKKSNHKPRISGHRSNIVS